MSVERVVVVSGPLTGQEFDILGTVTIGRAPESTIFLDDRQVSRKHALIERNRVGTVLKDLGSGNGTLVRNQRILEYRLSNGDIFQIGGAELRYEGQGTMIPGAGGEVDASAEEGPGGRVQFKDSVEGTIQSSDAENVFATFLGSTEKSTDVDELRATKDRLAAIYKANQIISSEHNLNLLFQRVLDQIFSLVPANNGIILINDRQTGELKVACERTGSGSEEIQVSSSIVKRAFDDKEAILVTDAAGDSRFQAAMSIVSGNIASAMCVPLMLQGAALGVLYVDTRGTANAFNQSDLELLVALAGPAAIAIRNAQFVEQMESEFQTTLRLLANAIELRDHYTVGHTWRVTRFSVIIAEEMGWDEEKLKIVEMGGVLHDVGKIGVEDSVLRKPGRLTEEEYAKMKIHPEKGAQLMKDSEKLQQLIPYCLYHHERFDGKGYPYGLAGEDIPIEGRIVAVADTFDAMTSTRPYRKGMDPEIAIQEIEKCKGTQFDPVPADAFIRAFRKGRMYPILQAYHEHDEKSIVCPFCSTPVQVPDKAEIGTFLDCQLCNRPMKLVKVNEALGGELLRDADLEGGGEAHTQTSEAEATQV